MPSTNDFLSKPLISLQEGKNCGIVTNMLFDANLKKVTDILVFDQIESAYYLLAANKIKFMENDAVVTTSSFDLLPYEDNVFNPINFDVFDVHGKHIGIVTEILLNKNYTVQSIECNGLHLTPSQIYSHSNDTLIINSTTPKPPRPKRTAKKKEALPVEKATQELSNISDAAEQPKSSPDSSPAETHLTNSTAIEVNETTKVSEVKTNNADLQQTEPTAPSQDNGASITINENAFDDLAQEQSQESAQAFYEEDFSATQTETTEAEAQNQAESPYQPQQELPSDNVSEALDAEEKIGDNRSKAYSVAEQSVELSEKAEPLYKTQDNAENVVADYSINDYAAQAEANETTADMFANDTLEKAESNKEEKILSFTENAETEPQINENAIVAEEIKSTNEAEPKSTVGNIETTAQYARQNESVADNVTDKNAVAQSQQNVTPAAGDANIAVNALQPNTQILENPIATEQFQQQLGSNRTITGTGSFMLGRRCDKNIMNRFNEIIVKQGSLITNETIKKAKLNGKLLELSMHAK